MVVSAKSLSRVSDDRELGSGECYRLAGERGIEGNRVTVVGIGECLT
jgi:hypothetical protein